MRFLWPLDKDGKSVYKKKTCNRVMMYFILCTNVQCVVLILLAFQFGNISRAVVGLKKICN